ncbi:hypothetical protein ACFQ3L_03165 [Lacticaseibacillus jixianensis]|uniref:ABC transporter permease n=1 Tax=Lacticaseibacillus jixianensis TaxID=2486012 RepID=A0ABW4B995_9LACO|nr:hypothetical protein [Lacticaseibacillus jixianensis]
MKHTVGLEWKRQPWQLGLVGLLAGFLVLIVPLIHWQPVPVDYKTFNYWPVTVTSEKRYMEHALESGTKDYSPQAEKGVGNQNPAETRAIGRRYQTMLKAFRRGDYLTVDRQIMKAFDSGVKDGPMWNDFDLPDIAYFGDFAVSGSRSAMQMRALYAYLVKHHINRIPMMGNNSGAGQAVTRELMYSRYFLVMLALMVLMLGLTYTRDHTDGTAAFSRTVPKSDVILALQKMLPALLWLNVAVVCSWALTMVVFALIPGQDFGSLMVPFSYDVHGEAMVMPLWQYTLLVWLVLNLWALFLAGLAYLFSLVIHQPVAMCFGLGLVVFARQLGLLGLVPDWAWNFLPSKYTLLPEMLTRGGEFINQQPWQWLLLYGGFIIVVWSLGGLLTWWRDHRRSRVGKGVKGGEQHA